MVEAHPIMRAIAKRLVLGVAAAAEGNHGAARQSKGGTRRIDDFEIAFDPDRTIIEGNNFDRHVG